MKKYIFVLPLLFINIFFISAQSPEAINYQAIARDLTGSPLTSTNVSLTFDILQGSSTGAVTYSEAQTKTTNQFGLFTAQIGSGTVVSGNFPTIAWGSNTYFLRITVNGDVMPATQLLSVPYALHAKTATSAVSGTPGADGINCWDTNGNGVNDASEDVNGDTFFNALDCAGSTGADGADGTDGQGINWLGTFAVAPTSPNTNDAYYDSALGRSYVWDGTTWQQMAQDGTAGTFIAGNGITIVGNTISAVDISATNEIQTLSTNAANDTIFLSNGGSVQLPSGTGIDTVAHTGANISGQGTAANPLVVTDGDTNDANEIQTLSTNAANDTIFLSNGGSVQLPSGTGIDTVAHTGSNISGQGTTANPLVVTDGDTDSTNELELPMTGNTVGDVLKWNGTAWESANDSVNDADASITNELQNLSWNTTDSNLIEISSGNTLPLSNTTPINGQVLTWDGAKWQAQAAGPGADNWGTQAVVSDATLTGTGIVGDTLRGFDGQYSSLTGTPTAKWGGAAGITSLTSLTDNVGIGIAATSHKLDVVGDINTNAIYRIDGETFLDNKNSNILVGATGNTSLTGADNTIIGSFSGQNSTTAISNTFVGKLSGNLNTSGSQNVAIGMQSSQNNLLGYNNVAIGYFALNKNTTSGNTAVGFSAMEENTTGQRNTALGYMALISNDVSNRNTAAGYEALRFTTGANNTSLGYSAGSVNTTGSDNTFIGHNANANAGSTGLINATAIGSGATVSTSNRVKLGNNADVEFDNALLPGGISGTAGQVLQSNGAGNAPTWVNGAAAAWNLAGNAGTTNGTNFIGTTDAQNLDIRTNNTIRHRFTQQGQIEFLNTGNSIFIGEGAGANDDLTSNSNTFIGYQSGATTTTGYYNVAIGSGSLLQNTTGNSNVATGYGSLLQNTTGNSNVATGRQSLNNNTTGSNNVAVGRVAGDLITTGSNNTFLGFNADANANNLTNATAIGANARVGASNAIVLGSINGVNGATVSTNVGIGTETPTAGLNIVKNVGTPLLELEGSGLIGGGLHFTYTSTSEGYQIRSDDTGGINLEASGSNKISFETSSTERMRITGSGNIGIGTIAPTERLDVVGNMRFSGALMPNNQPGAAGQVLQSNGAGSAPTWATASVSPWTISGSYTYQTTLANNVGIGTSTPTRKLQVNDNSANPAVYIQQAGAGAGLSVYSNTSASAQTVFQTSSLGGGASGFYIKGDGEVGIGLSSAMSGRLHVRNSTATWSTYNNALYGEVTGATQSSRGVAGVSSATGLYGIGLYGSASGAATRNYAVYGTATGATNNWAGYFENANVYIEENLGIGTATPNAKLEVEETTGTYAQFIDFDKSGTGIMYGLNIDVDNTSTGSSITYGMFSGAQNNGGSSVTFGVVGYASGTSSGDKMGGYFYTAGSGTRWSIYALGNAFNSGGTWQPSDERLKKSVNVFEGAIDKLKQLDVKTYYFKTEEYPTMNFSDRKQYGIMAQSLETIFPEMVLEAEHNLPNVNGKESDQNMTIKAVNYNQLIPISIKAIQEQQTELEKLKTENEKLKQELLLIKKHLGLGE